MKYRSWIRTLAAFLPIRTPAVLIDLASHNGGAFGGSGRTARTVTLTPDNLGYVIDGRTRLNYHTAANGSGENRGQVVR